MENEAAAKPKEVMINSLIARMVLDYLIDMSPAAVYMDFAESNPFLEEKYQQLLQNTYRPALLLNLKHMMKELLESKQSGGLTLLKFLTDFPGSLDDEKNHPDIRCFFTHSRDSPLDPPKEPYHHEGNDGRGIAPLCTTVQRTPVSQVFLTALAEALQSPHSPILFSPDGTRGGVKSIVLTNAHNCCIPRSKVYSAYYDLWSELRPQYSIFASGVTPRGHVVVTKDFTFDQRKRAKSCAVIHENFPNLLDEKSCEIITTLFETNLEVVDNVSFYAKGWALFFLACLLERQAGTKIFPATWRPVDTDIFISVKFDDLYVGGPFQSHIKKGYFFFREHELSLQDVNCLAHLARSGYALDPIADELNPCLNRFKWFAVPIVMLYESSAPTTSATPFDAKDMHRMLMKVSQSRGEHEACLRGFFYATMLMCSIDRSIDGPRVPYEAASSSPSTATDITTPLPERLGISASQVCTYNCIGEIITSEGWPECRDSNPISRWLGKVQFTDGMEEMSEATMDEYYVLGSESYMTTFELSILAGAVLSAGAGLSLHLFNITGEVLNNSWSVTTKNGRLYQQHIHRIFDNRDPTNCSEFFKIISSQLQAVSPYTIDPMMFRRSQWCGPYRERININATNYWAASWPQTVPYVLHPMSLSWIYKIWPNQYSLSQTDVRIDMTGRFKFGLNNEERWTSIYGDSRYLDIVRNTFTGEQRDYAYHWIGYGIQCLNAIYKSLRLLQPVPIKFDRVMGTAQGGRIVGGVLLSKPLIAGTDYDADLHFIIPGAVTSYDWEDDVILAPEIHKNDLIASDWYRIRYISDDQVIPNTGLIANFRNPNPPRCLSRLLFRLPDASRNKRHHFF